MSVIRGGLCLVTAFSVLALGAVEVWSAAIVEIGAAALLILWAILILVNPLWKLRWNALLWPMLALLAIGLLQLFLHATAYAYLTRIELLRLTACIIIFFLAVQAFQKRSDFVSLAWFLMILCFAVSLLGIIQHFTSSGEIYWMPSLSVPADPFGPFVNRNHFAGFVELTLPVGLGLMAFRGMRAELVPLAAVLAIVPVSALVLSGSRGGIVTFVFELCVLAILAGRSSLGEGSRLLALGIVAFMALAFVAWIGAGKTIQRFSNARQDLSLSRRASMFRGAAAIFLAHPVTGAGLGALVAVYPRYETVYDGFVVQHVHNDYIEALAETGAAGGVCVFAFLWLLFRDAKKGFQEEQGHFERGLRAGAIVAVSGLLLHSLVDFNLHIPSNALFFLLQAYLATAAPLTRDTRGPQHPPRSREVSIVAG